MANYVCSQCILRFVIAEPDVGMPEVDGNRFFKQLLSGVVSYFSK